MMFFWSIIDFCQQLILLLDFIFYFALCVCVCVCVCVYMHICSSICGGLNTTMGITIRNSTHHFGTGCPICLDFYLSRLDGLRHLALCLPSIWITVVCTTVPCPLYGCLNETQILLFEKQTTLLTEPSIADPLIFSFSIARYC